MESISTKDGDLQLFRAYLGRTEVAGGADIDVFIDDWQSFTGGAIRTWYDGVGYALVSDIVEGLLGDYNNNGIVDAADYTIWRDHLGQTFQLQNEGPDSPGEVTIEDYNLWVSQFGLSSGAAASSGLAAVPEPAALLLSVFVALAATLIRRRR
jgi:hypothetical protein